MQSGADLRAVLLKAGIWLILAVALAPVVAMPVGTGLDASYLWGINALPETGSRHGLDVVFPYGPLGPVMLPAAVSPASGGDGLRAAALARLALHLLLAGLLALRFRGVPPARAAWAAALLLLSYQLGLSYDSRLLLLLALLLGPALTGGRLAAGTAALAGALTAVFVLIKVNLAAGAGALLGGTLLWAAFQARRTASHPSAGGLAGAGRALAAGVGAFLAASALALPLFGGGGEALRWLGGQLDLARGFGGAMSAPGLPGELAAGLLALAAIAVLTLQAVLRRAPLAGFWAVHLVPVWLSFKHGYVRQDGHVVVLFTYLLGLCAVAVLLDRDAQQEAPRRAGTAPLTAALLILVLGAVPAAQARRADGRKQAYRQASGAHGAAYLRQAIGGLDALRARQVERSREELAPRRLPWRLMAPLRTAGVGVDAVPWELSYLPANRLRWAPNPVLQLYNAYTRPLDLRAARHFAGAERRPPADVLLAEFAGVDARHMLWDSPETWRAIVQHYEPAWELPAPDAPGQVRLLGLRRRSAPPAWAFQEIGVQRARAGEWIAVPAVAGWTFAHLELRPALRGRLVDLAFRPEPVLVETLYDDGVAVRWRLVAETAPGGLLLGPSPRTTAELAGLWRGAPGPRVVRIRLAGPGLAGDGDEVRITWREGRLVPAAVPPPAPAPPGAPPAPPPGPAAAPPAGTPRPPR